MEGPNVARSRPSQNTVQAEEVIVGLLIKIGLEVGPKEFELAQLCLLCLKLDGEKLESAREVLGLYNILSSKLHLILPPGQKCSAIAITKVILLAVGVGDTGELIVDEQELKVAENLLTFPKLLLEICSRLGSEDYHSFRGSICHVELDCNPERVSSPVELMKKLLHTTKISQTNVDILITWLEHIRRIDLAEKVKRYKDDRVTNHEAVDLCQKVSPETNSHSQDSSSQTHKLVIATEESTNSGQSQVVVSMTQPTRAKSSESYCYPQVVSPSRGIPVPFYSQASAGSKPNNSIEEVYQDSGTDHDQSSMLVTPLQDTQKPGNRLPEEVCAEPDEQTLKLEQTATTIINKRIWQVWASDFAILSVLLLVPLACWLVCSDFSQLHTLARPDDTIILNQENSFIKGLTKSSIKVGECKKAGDNSLPITIFVLPSNSLPYKTKKEGTEVAVMNKSEASCETGGARFLYLLPSSVIDYEICLKLLVIKDVFNGNFYIFDSEEAYEDYIKDTECDGKDAVESRNLILGSGGKHHCTTIKFEAKKEGYYSFASATPAKISYYYKYNISRRSLDPSGLPSTSRKCTFFKNNDDLCEIKLPYKSTAMAYVHPLPQLESSATHLCVSCDTLMCVLCPALQVYLIMFDFYFLIIFILSMVYRHYMT